MRSIMVAMLGLLVFELLRCSSSSSSLSNVLINPCRVSSILSTSARTRSIPSTSTRTRSIPQQIQSIRNILAHISLLDRMVEREMMPLHVLEAQCPSISLTSNNIFPSSMEWYPSERMMLLAFYGDLSVFASFLDHLETLERNRTSHGHFDEDHALDGIIRQHFKIPLKILLCLVHERIRFRPVNDVIDAVSILNEGLDIFQEIFCTIQRVRQFVVNYESYLESAQRSFSN